VHNFKLRKKLSPWYSKVKVDTGCALPSISAAAKNPINGFPSLVVYGGRWKTR